MNSMNLLTIVRQKKWILITSFFVVMIIISLFAVISLNKPSTSNKNIITIPMTAQQFEFNVTTITVNFGDTVRIVITSKDIIHGFGITEFGLRETIPVEKFTTIEFQANQIGTFDYFCTKFCGTGHANHKGTLTILP